MKPCQPFPAFEIVTNRAAEWAVEVRAVTVRALDHNGQCAMVDCRCGAYLLRHLAPFSRLARDPKRASEILAELVAAHRLEAEVTPNDPPLRPRRGEPADTADTAQPIGAVLARFFAPTVSAENPPSPNGQEPKTVGAIFSPVLPPAA